MLCLVLVGRLREKKEKEIEKWPGGFYPGLEAGHTLLSVLCN
jgi:hypothetical protein